jgi:hypothetical protein
MNSIEEKQKQRFKFLNKVYKLTGDSQFHFVNMFEIGEELGFDRETTVNVEQFLYEERLIENLTAGGDFTISHRGVCEVEKALSNPDKPTTYFPPVSIIHVGQMINSQIQQSSPGGIQSITFPQEKHNDLKKVLTELKESIDQLNLKDQQCSDLRAEMQTIEAQMTSSKPKSVIITESLGSIRRILEGAVGSAIASSLLSKILALLGVS